MNGSRLSIGQFARRSGQTVKALRYDGRIGLLPPSEVDSTDNFRWYTTSLTKG